MNIYNVLLFYSYNDIIVHGYTVGGCIFSISEYYLVFTCISILYLVYTFVRLLYICRIITVCLYTYTVYLTVYLLYTHCFFKE